MWPGQHPARTRIEVDSLEVADFAKEGACGDDGEAEPQAPDDATEDGDNLVSEELARRGSRWARAGSISRDGRTGGKDMTNRMAMGIVQPNGRLE